jgi:hypothetical protein
MSLIWHQLRKDIRQHRLFLAAWLAVLAAEFAFLAWLCPRAAVAGPGSGSYQTLRVTGLLGFLHLVFGAALPALVVLADSPARRDGFLATRPMPGRALLLAKAGFIAALVLLPAVLQEAATVASLGTPWLYVARAAGERAVKAALLALVPACLALYWGSLREYVTEGLGLLLGLWVVLVGAAVVASRVVPALGQPPPSASLMARAVWCAVLILPFALARGTHLARQRRHSVVVAAGVLACLTYLLWPWDAFRAPRRDACLAEPALAKATIDVPLPGIGVNSYSYQGSMGHLHGPSVDVHIELIPPPAGWQVRWYTESATVSSGGRTAICPSLARRRPIFEPHYRVAIADDARAWAALLGPDALIDAGNGFMRQPNSASVRLPADVLGNDGVPHEVALSCTFAGDAFRWERVADLPLTPGARADLPLWHCTVTRATRAGAELRVSLLLREVLLGMTADPNLSRAGRQQLPDPDRHEFLLYSPADRLGVAGGLQSWGDSAGFGSGATAAGSAHLALRYTVPAMVPELAADPDWRQARLVVLRRTYIGSLSRRWDSGPLLLRASPRYGHPPAAGDAQPSDAEFRQRLAALVPPPPDAPRAAVGQYVYEVLRLVEDKRLMPEPFHPCVQALAAYVPTHLDLFLDGLAASTSLAEWTLLAALTAGATEEQKPAVMGHLAQEPRLVGVILNRGWLDEARDSLYALLQRAGGLEREELRALAWFEDPRTYPRLLAEFEARPSLAYYALLRRLPGISPALDASVIRIWRRRPPVIRSADVDWDTAPVVAMALRRGEAEALRETYRRLSVYRDDGAGNRVLFLDALRDSLITGMPADTRHDPDALATWLLKHRPEDFHYDAARQRFVLTEK